MSAEMASTASRTCRSCDDRYISIEMATVEATIATMVAQIRTDTCVPMDPRRLSCMTRTAAPVATDVQIRAVTAMMTRSTAPRIMTTAPTA